VLELAGWLQLWPRRMRTNAGASQDNDRIGWRDSLCAGRCGCMDGVLMKISFALPPGFTVLGTIVAGALLWVGAQLPSALFGLLTKHGPAIIQAASAPVG
jgi:hypothetical protein